MANKQYLSVLKQGPDAWNEWVEEHLDPALDGSVDLTDADLSNADLCGADLAEADLSNANLSGADLRDADLSAAGLGGADLSGAGLNGADLSVSCLEGADLDGADLSVADLVGAELGDASLVGTNLKDTDLRDANFTGADLSGADLMRADLKRATLTGANLSGANLSNARLNDTDLNGADLSSATIGFTIFANTDLGTVKGLDSINHVGPSTIGIDALVKSGGKLPDAFLRGCGIPDDFITYARSLAGKSLEFYSCFISYSRQDLAFASRMQHGLESRGIRCWMDEHDTQRVQDADQDIGRGIGLWDKILLCVSENSVTREWVDDEINSIMDREQELRKEAAESVLALVPLNLDGYLFTGWTSPNAALVKRQLAADFNGWESDNAMFEAGLERVVSRLRTDGG